jgi:hypothetical protein
MINLFCDLDGVLVDFDRGVFEITGKYPHQFKNVGYMWSALEKDPTFWVKLHWTRDGQMLWDFISQNNTKFNVQILTGLPEGNLKQSSDGFKRAWCNYHLGRPVATDHACGPTIKVNTCTGSKKYKFCGMGDILIDDRYDYKEDWENAGGIFVHHTSSEKTIQELTKILSLGDNYVILQEAENQEKIANPTPIFDPAKFGHNKFKFEYLGVFLTVAARKQLFKMFPPLLANKYGDHITLAFRPSDSEIQKFVFNKLLNFRIVGYAHDEKCQTVIVRFDDEILNTKLFHITISTTRNTQPAYSNELIERGFDICSSDISDIIFTGKTGAIITVEQYSHDANNEKLSGISEEIKEMIFRFMVREIQSDSSVLEEKLIFPKGSLDSEARQIIHQFAEENNIISESIGDKNDRQLILRKPKEGEEVVVRKRKEKPVMRLLFDEIQ